MKGSKFERELVHMLWEKGFAAVRVPASGSISHPVPDVIAGNGQKYIAIEVKARSNLPIYISEREVNDLVDFSRIFGAEPFIGVKIRKIGWKFLKIEHLKKTKVGYKIDEEVYNLGLKFEDIIK